MDGSTIRDRLSYWQRIHQRLQEAYLALIEGGVKEYTIGDRTLTKFDLPQLRREMEDAEQKIAELEGALTGKRPRRAFGVVPRDW